MKRTAVLLSALVVLTAAVALAEEVAPAFSREAIGVKSYPAAPRLAAAAGAAPAAVLGAADATAIEEIHAWNAEGRAPAKNGFTRGLPELVAVKLTGAVASKGSPAKHAGGIVATSDRGLVWSGTFNLAAHRVRLRLDNVKLPAGAVLWIYNDSAPIAFDSSLLDPDGGLWTPSVRGGIVHLEIEIPMPKSDADGASFEISRVLELIATRTEKPEINGGNTSCLTDVQCVTTAAVANINDFKQGVAYLEYVKNNSGFICSGGLLNDTDTSSFVPYFLTANHCFNTQASASSLEAYFDWRYQSCVSASAPLPAPVVGATLLATNASTDFTLVRLNSVPSNRYFFGWTTASQPNGTLLHRVSHPAPGSFGAEPQSYSATNINTTFSTCTGRSRPNYIYSTQNATQGGVWGGSSGSVAVLSSGQVVGQLLGSCGPDPGEGCDIRNATVDGAFATTFASISQFISGSPTGPAACTPSANTICLNNDRFAVSVTFRAGASASNATAIEYTADSGLFWFFSATNIEMLIKILNACPVNNAYWVFAAATTDLEYTITVTDTKTGSVKTYFHGAGTPAPAITDTTAFTTSCP